MIQIHNNNIHCKTKSHKYQSSNYIIKDKLKNESRRLSNENLFFIFLDWEDDGSVDHVGIVIKVKNNEVYTVEGNSIDGKCRQLVYNIDSNVIFGYGVPNY